MPFPSRQRGMFFDEFAPGQKIRTAARTVTEADIVGFAGLSGDFNQIHTDAVYAATTPFGQRVAHGLCVLSIASGLTVQTGIMEGTILAFREIQEWKFAAPVRIGETIFVDLEVVETKAIPRIGGGAVTLVLEVKNQSGAVVQKGKWTALFASRAAEARDS
ncbi:MAG: dehydratase [Anaerolineales bacterium]|nr:dehydratase [Anaerolineales bacterium]